MNKNNITYEFLLWFLQNHLWHFKNPSWVLTLNQRGNIDLPKGSPFPKRDLKYIWSMDDSYRSSLKKQCFSMPGKSLEFFYPSLDGGWATYLKKMLVKLDHFPSHREAQWALESRVFFCDLFVTFDEWLTISMVCWPGCTGNTHKKITCFRMIHLQELTVKWHHVTYHIIQQNNQPKKLLERKGHISKTHWCLRTKVTW